MSDNITRHVYTEHGDEKEHRRQLGFAINRLIDGKINSTGSVTLTANAATTVVSDARSGSASFIEFMPTTANAATEKGAGGMYVSARTAGTGFTITHANNAQNDRTFIYVILG